VVLLAAVAFVFLVVKPENPELSARALIGLERPIEVSGVKEGVTANLGREDIMMSRTFLKDVVRKLSLQLWTAPHGREEMFDSVTIDSSASCGTYCVRFSPQRNGEFLIYYYDTTAIALPIFGFLPGNNFKIISLGKWASDMPVHLPGISLKFSRSIRERPRAFTFRVVDIRVAVEAIYRNLTIKRADPDKGINYIAVLLASRDYSLAAATANAIADAFIEKNLSFSQSRVRGVVESLDKQLRLAQANLASAESKIRDFQSQHPQVGLNQQTQQTVSSLAQLDNGIQNISTDMANAANLRNGYLNSDSLRRLQIAGEIAELLSSRSVPAGKTLKEELNQLLTQQHEMTGKYGTEHPFVLENNRNLQRVSRTIAAALDLFISSAQTALSNKQQNVQQLSGRLRQLPALEMQLGELRRNQQIFTDIYSAVLSRYNQAKVADAVETAAFYIMDYAVAPLPPPADPSRLLILSVLIALLVSFGPVFIYNFFDKSVRSQRQLARITSHAVLEAIPIFFQADEKHRARTPGYHPLINFACNPNFTREIFDSLLVKIKLLQFESTDHCIVVSSFEGGCGKSTISANLAIAIALQGHRTVLVDGDLRRGTVKDIFNLPDSGGLAALLSGQKPLTEDDCIRSMVITKIPNLYVIPSGKEPSNPGLLLSSPRMEEFRRLGGKQAAYMVIDTPPLGIVSDAVVIQKYFAHYIFVVRSGKTNVMELVNRINEFDRLPEKILGYVLNGASHDAVGTYRRYSKYYAR
jgi:tyrosine-protein kinase Etk/Wzc